MWTSVTTSWWFERAAPVVRIVAGLAVIAAPAATAQREGSPVGAQVHVMSVVTPDLLAGAGVGVTVRASRRAGVVGSATVGRQNGSTGVRWEGAVVYRLETGGGSGVWYGGGGVTVQRFAVWREYLLVVLGLERWSGGSIGWFGEIGLGGGIRGALGIRLRPTRQP